MARERVAAEHAAAQCAPLPKAAADAKAAPAARKRPAAKVVDEKPGD